MNRRERPIYKRFYILSEIAFAYRLHTNTILKHLREGKFQTPEGPVPRKTAMTETGLPRAQATRWEIPREALEFYDARRHPNTLSQRDWKKLDESWVRRTEREKRERTRGQHKRDLYDR